jgi:P-type E1-E2 ATPase
MSIDPLLIELPNQPAIILDKLVLDYTGTLSLDGVMLPGVAGKLRKISKRMQITVLTADTFGKAKKCLAGLPCEVHIIKTGKDKEQLVTEMGAHTVIAVGNGQNDVAMIRAAAIGIAVIGPEGASGNLLTTAKIIVKNILDALDLVLNPLRLKAALRQ